MSYAMGMNNPTFRSFAKKRVNNFLLGIKRRPDQLGFVSPNGGFGAGIINTPKISNEPGKFATIFSSAIGLASQAIGAWGKNNTTQISANQGNVAALPTPYGSAGTTTQQAAINQAQLNQSGGVGASAVQTGASFFDGLAQSFGISTSTLMLLGIGGAYLLFRTPPKSR